MVRFYSFFKIFLLLTLFNRNIGESLQSRSLYLRMPWDKLKFNKWVDHTDLIIRPQTLVDWDRFCPYKGSSVSLNRNRNQSFSFLTDWWVFIKTKLISVYWNLWSDDRIGMIKPFANFLYFYILCRKWYLLHKFFLFYYLLKMSLKLNYLFSLSVVFNHTRWSLTLCIVEVCNSVRNSWEIVSVRIISRSRSSGSCLLL